MFSRNPAILNNRKFFQSYRIFSLSYHYPRWRVPEEIQQFVARISDNYVMLFVLNHHDDDDGEQKF